MPIQAAKYYQNIDEIVLIVKTFSQGNKMITIGCMIESHYKQKKFYVFYATNFKKRKK